MHISDGVIPPADPIGAALLGGGFVFAAVGLAFSCRRVRPAEVPRIGIIAAWVFVASSIIVPIGVIPVHLGLYGLAGFFLRRRLFLAIVPALILQMLLLHEGGWTTLGLNATTTSLGALAGWGLSVGPKWVPLRARAFAAGFAGIAAGAAVVVGALVLVHYDLRVLAFFVSYLALAAMEGVVTALAIEAVLRLKPNSLE